MITLEKIDRLTSIFQSLVTGLGIVVGGIWVLVTFSLLGSTQKARFEIAESESRATKEAWTIRQSILSIDFKWEVFGKTSEGKRLVGLKAVLQNNGKAAYCVNDIRLQIAPFMTDKIDPAALQKFESHVLGDDGKLYTMPPRIFRSATTRSFAFLLPPVVPGNYLIQLRATYSDPDPNASPNNECENAGAIPGIDAVEQAVVNVPN